MIDQQQEIQTLFERQQRHAPKMEQTTAKERVERLRRLEKFLLDDQKMQGLFDALDRDFRKSPAEVLLSEIAVAVQHLRHTRRSLARWMMPRRVPTPLLLTGTSSYIQYEPKGVCLIIAPWNYPFNLAISPLIDAIAAGNTAIIKPSEMSANTSAFIKKMLGELFPPEEVAVVECDAATATALLQLPFNHIFFTGSPKIGKIIMAAAAKNLASVTLELGGKSPAIIDETANVRTIAYRLAWGKLLNKGQTCIAPDYVIIHESRLKEFLGAFQSAVKKLYGEGEIAENRDYCRIINQNHFQRLRNLYEDAMAKGAREEMGGNWNKADCFIPPTVLTNITEDMDISQEEIFGPILPVVTYTSPEEAVRIVNHRPKPLTLYVSSRNKKFSDYILKNTSSGGAVVNDFMLGFGNPDLGFGGINNSGIGNYMGFSGFQEFSNPKSVVYRHFLDMSVIFPPYNSRVIKMLNAIKRWFA